MKNWCFGRLPTEIIKKSRETYLRFHYRNTQHSIDTASKIGTRNTRHSSLFWHCYTGNSRCLTRKNRLYEWLHLRRSSGVRHWANLELQYRSDAWEHICPQCDLQQLLGNDTNLLPGSNRIYSCRWSLFVLGRGLLHSGLCNCYIHPL